MLTLVLPDGRQVVADVPTPAVTAAVKRAAAALGQGRKPKRSDARTIRLWLAAQEERHGGVR